MRHPPATYASLALIAVALIGLSRAYDAAPPQLIGATIAGGTLAFLLLVANVRDLRAYFESTTTEMLILSHAIRAPIGVSFLVLAAEDMMPNEFALRAGYGDLATAIFGLIAVIACTGISSSRSRYVYLTWNVLGIMDLFFAVGTGMAIGLREDGSMIWLARLPLLVVPTVVLPYLFGTHVLMFKRLLRSPIVEGQAGG